MTAAQSTQKKRDWWASAEGRAVYSKYAIRRLFGYEGYQSLKNRNWTLTGLLNVGLGVVADISQIFGPVALFGLIASLLAASVFGIIILRRLKFCSLCAVPFVVSLILTVIFGGVTIAQQTDPSPKDGVVSDLIPAIKELQGRMLVLLGQIRDTTEDTNQRVIEIQAAQAEQTKLLREMSEKHDRHYAEMFAIYEKENGVSRSAMIEHLVSLGANPDITIEEIPQFLEKFAVGYQEFKANLNSLDIDDPKLAEIRERASTRLEAGDLDGARNVLNTARQAMARGRKEDAVREATLLSDEAAVDKLDLEYVMASSKYLEAATLTRFDPQVSARYSFMAGQALYREGDEFGDRKSLMDAEILFQNLLPVYEQENVPVSWGLVQMNRGNVLAKLGEREAGTGHLEEAIRAYRRALEVLTRANAPNDWATTQNNLGGALLRQAVRTDSETMLKAAIEAFENSILEHTRARSPFDWATAKNNLGNAYKSLAAFEDNDKRLIDAINSYQDALKVWTRDRVPNYWASAQSNLGNTLHDLGASTSNAEYYVDAIAAYQNALSVTSRKRAPMLWATIQNNLGNTQLSLAHLERSKARLTESIASLRLALEERTRERAPADWATTQNNLGLALSTKGELEQDAGQIRDAVDAHRNALVEFTKERAPSNWASTTANLAYAYRTLGDVSGVGEDYVASADQFRALLEANLAAIFPKELSEYVAEFTLGHCWSLYRAIRVSRSLRYLDRSQQVCAASRQLPVPAVLESATHDAAYALAMTHAVAGEVRSDRALLEGAMKVLQELLNNPQLPNDHRLRAEITRDVEEVKGALWHLQDARP